MPMVCAPRSDAPRADASITPPRPPQMSVAPCAPISRPTWCASSRTSTLAPSPSPITAIAGRRCIFGSHTKQRRELGNVGDHKIRRRDAVGQRYAALVHPHHTHRGTPWREHVLARRVANEQHCRRLDSKHREDTLIDERVGFAEAGLGRNYHCLEKICDPGIEQDLAPALRVVEVGEQTETEVRREAAYGIRALGRRKSDLAHAVHVDACQMKGEMAPFGGIGVAQSLQSALETLLAGYFGAVAFAFRVNLVDHVVIKGEEPLEIEARAHPLLQRRQYP